MKKSKFTDEQIAYALRRAESGMPVVDVCRQLGVSEEAFYVWKRKYAELSVGELRQLRQLTEENARFKCIVADLALDKQILQEVIKRRSEASAQARDRQLDLRSLPGEHRALLCAGQDHESVLVLPQPRARSEHAAYAHP